MATLRELQSLVRAKVVAFLFFLGVLADFFGVTDRLDAILPAIAAFIPLAAWAGTVFFGVLLAERIWWGVQDRRNRGPARHDFKCLRPSILQCQESLLALPDMTDESTRTARRDALHSTAETELETLAHDLSELGIPVLPASIFPFIHLYSWTEFLSRLEVYARDGRLEAAARLGWQMRRRTKEVFH